MPSHLETPIPTHAQPVLCETELVAVLVSISNNTPHILTLDQGSAFPSGPLMVEHRSLQKGMRNWVEQQTGLKLGHTEQLYTFADPLHGRGHQMVRISYMAFIRQNCEHTLAERSIYDYFPWEDRRDRASDPLLHTIAGRLRHWAGDNPHRWQRCATVFGLDNHAWNDELSLQRYELLWEAGLVPESTWQNAPVLPGLRMHRDYRRILATALSRMRAKIRYTPAVFDLLPRQFTLLQLQQAMEALAGRAMHKQNFRRLVQQQKLVSRTAEYDSPTQGRPAQLYQFAPETAENCYLAGAKLPLPAIS
ncbi:NrtR DNA-binding winged helix domain-containing protein [Acetobacter sp. LMG 32666]|uniref:NUDIX hydrolase n=1 Tax=Acetobacter sp. LMG 32666 TaxID=2959295 RepID=UPI0030C8510B